MSVFGFWLYINHKDPDFINDERFINAANLQCAEAQTELEDAGPAARNATNEERARVIDGTTATFAELATDLKELEPEVAPDAAPAVRRWLQKWDEFVAVGSEYAAAMRRGNRAEIDRIGNKADDPAEYINDFAEANDMPKCVF